MKISVDRATLAEEMRLCSYAVAKRDVIPIMNCVLLRADGETLHVAATDLDVTFTTAIPADVEERGACVVDFDVLRRSVVESPEDQVSLSTDDAKRLTVTSGPFRIVVPVMDAGDFPVLPETPEPKVTAAWSTVQDLLSRVTHAAASDELSGSFTLRGVALQVTGGKLAAMATDRHRLSLAEVNGQPRTLEFVEMIQPRACALIIAANSDEDAAISSDGRNATFASSGRVVYSRKFNVNFPNVRECISASVATGIVSASDLSGVIRRSKIARSETLRLSLARGTIGVETTTQRGDTSETIATDYSDVEFTVGFEASYISDAVSAMRSDRIALEFSKLDENGPILLRAEPPDDTCNHIEVVMPRRL